MAPAAKAAGAATSIFKRRKTSLKPRGEMNRRVQINIAKAII